MNQNGQTNGEAKSVRFHSPLTIGEREINLSPIPETPEPASIQQRRNVAVSSAHTSNGVVHSSRANHSTGAAPDTPTTSYLTAHSFDTFLNTIAAKTTTVDSTARAHQTTARQANGTTFDQSNKWNDTQGDWSGCCCCL